jgi:DNA-binding transcriptional LysR family regulator
MQQRVDPYALKCHVDLGSSRPPLSDPPRQSGSRRIDPVTLRLFVAVLDTGAIAAAAVRENIAPSAVSKRLSDLEDGLNTLLLQRSNRGIEPTAAGRELLNLARGVLNELDNIYWQIKEHSTGARGLVRVFANISAITEFLPGPLRSFSARYPSIQIQLQEKVSDMVLKGVATNAADVGLYVPGKSVPAGVSSIPYQRDELVLATPVDHPLAGVERITVAETLDYDYVGLHTGSAINQQLLRCARDADRPLKCRVQVTSFDALSLMIEAGMGIGVMPRMIGERFASLNRLRISKLDEDWAVREFHICTRSSEALPVAARLFFDHLRSESIFCTAHH